MLRFLAVTLCLLAAASGLAGQNAETPVQVVNRYLDALARSMRKGTTAADVDRVLAFYTDDVVYEDPRVKVTVRGRDQMRAGMLSHLGDYTGDARIEVRQTAAAANAVAAAVTEIFWTEENGRQREIRRERLKVFEFEGTKIRRVIDFH